ncbi:MAG: periplasmic protein CpxP/Spy [Pyrinomonadaceae bacterium]|jgi:Spy/CpxP family protein refolding chaperone|nr:periplasmic protein CpxP/Spy [Pyrinomonadaceae bacterium]
MRVLIKKLSPRQFAIAAPAVVLALCLSAGAGVARAQVGNAPAENLGAQGEPDAARRVPNAAGLLRVLNLTPEQRAQIGSIRRETEPQGRLLGARLRQARRALDEAIYAPTPDEGVIEERLRELGAAQSAVVRLRSLTELRIRRVLSPEQLDAFRRLQRQTRTRRQQRLNQRQPQPQDDLPGDAPARFQDRMRRRRLEQQQQRLSNELNPPPAPRERRPAPPAPARDRRP